MVQLVRVDTRYYTYPPPVYSRASILPRINRLFICRKIKCLSYPVVSYIVSYRIVSYRIVALHRVSMNRRASAAIETYKTLLGKSEVGR